MNNEKTYASELSKILEALLSLIQETLEKLEKPSTLVSYLEGKTRVYIFNPIDPFLNEFKILLLKAYEFIPEKFRCKCYEPKIRKLP